MIKTFGNTGLIKYSTINTCVMELQLHSLLIKYCAINTCVVALQLH
jgi:hypothetical protein